MRCLICNSSHQTTVIDSRPLSDDTETRRRRRCLDCGGRFTTIERHHDALPDHPTALRRAFKLIRDAIAKVDPEGGSQRRTAHPADSRAGI